jgi:hypothetical protein
MSLLLTNWGPFSGPQLVQQSITWNYCWERKRLPYILSARATSHTGSRVPPWMISNSARVRLRRTVSRSNSKQCCRKLSTHGTILQENIDKPPGMYDATSDIRLPGGSAPHLACSFGWWLICSEWKVLLASCWWLICSERRVLLAGG